VAEITATLVKELREKSGAGMMDCKKALQATDGDPEKAMDELRKQGLATAQKKSARVTKEGAVDAYIHRWVTRDEVPAEVTEREKAIYAEQVKGKPENVIDKIVTGKLDKFFAETCLMEQPFIKDPDRTIDQVRTDLVGLIGENVEVRRFARFQLGETVEQG
jgi:elongation factor Ts